MAKQKIRTVLIPESGIDLEPKGVMESLVETDFIRTLSHIIGMSPAGAIMLRATTGGDLRVATVSMAYEVYEVHAGVAAAAYNAGDTFITALPSYVTDCLIETFAGTIEFMNQAGVWGDPKSLPVGFYSFDFIHYGIRIQNRVAINLCDYELTMYR